MHSKEAHGGWRVAGKSWVEGEKVRMREGKMEGKVSTGVLCL